MSRVIRSDAAENDLFEIGRYIAQDNLDAALRLMDRIDHICNLLAGNPLLGELWPELGKNIRHYTVRKYVVFYRPVEDGIEIVRVLHGSRDIPQTFHKE